MGCARPGSPRGRKRALTVHTVPGQALIGCRQGLAWPVGSRACPCGVMVGTCDVGPTRSAWSERGAPPVTRRGSGKRASLPTAGDPGDQEGVGSVPPGPLLVLSLLYTWPCAAPTPCSCATEWVLTYREAWDNSMHGP